MIVWPPAPAVTVVVGVVSVPVPSAAYTLIDGLDAMALSEPPAVDFSVVVQVAAPAVLLAVAVLPATQDPPLTAP